MMMVIIAIASIFNIITVDFNIIIIINITITITIIIITTTTTTSLVAGECMSCALLRRFPWHYR